MYKKKSVSYTFKIALAALVISGPLSAIAQPEFKGLENLFTPPKSYVINYVQAPPKIDGDINDAVWQNAAWTDNFVDIEGDLKPLPPLKTKMKMLWDDTCLYLAVQLDDPNVWATLKKHDEVVFHDNDFELFVDPVGSSHQYFEIEVNALNTIFDLYLNKPYRNHGNPLSSWDAQGMRSAVKIQGTLNDPSDKDKGWTVEMAIPFKAIGPGFRNSTPRDGAVWRINFSRVEYDTKVIDGKSVKLKGDNGRDLPEHNCVWSPQGVINMHFPERWGYLQFNKNSTNTFTLPYAELQKRYLWLAYYREKQWLDEHQSYTLNLKDLGLTESIAIDNKDNTLQIEATPHQFMVLITDKKDNITHTINQDGLVGLLNTRPNE